MRLASLAALALAALAALGCARQECDFHSQCGALRYCDRGRCRQDCRRDFDCDTGRMCSELGQCVQATDAGPGSDAGPPPGVDAGPPGIDSGPPPGVDSGPPPGVDSGPPPGVDSGPPPGVDSGPPTGTRRYLDRCTSDGECASGRCVDDVGGTRACSIACVSHRDCASEHVCAAGVCRYDDTGAVCSTATPAACVLGLCVGNATTGTGHCTRQCESALDCPSGYACADAGGTRVCVDIERPCSGASQCATGLCLSVQGCTAECRTAADCPRTFAGVEYTCAIAFGSARPICVPSSFVVGADPIGAACRVDGSGLYYLCRSAGCDEEAPTGAMCTQICTQEGGCGPGLGCWPSVEGGSILQICSRAGTRAMGQPCGTGRECDSGLCDATGGYCTRLCTDDGLCPSDMRCETVPGFPVSICRR